MARHRPRRTRLAIVAVLASLALVAAGCGDDDEPEVGTGGETGTETAEVAGTLNGSGATFPAAFYEEAIAEFTADNPDATVTYGGGGSGKGRQDLADQVVDFAGSDALVKDADIPGFKGGEFLYFPTVAAPITVSYNLPDVDELMLDADVLARIFQAQITTWDDPAIAALNPDADLPGTGITVAHRSDGSGTTENFTRFLAAAAPGTWTLGSGSTVTWPANTQAGNGNSGVAQIVSGTEGAVGYVDLADATATDLQTALVENAAGEFMEPTLDGASAALDGADVEPNLAYNPLNAEGADAYPITAPTWILVYKTQPADKVDLLKAWLEYLLTDAQDFANDVDYAQLPDGMREDALAQLDEIVAR